MTPPKFQSGDKATLEIRLTNTSSNPLTGIAYVDSLPEYFELTDGVFTAGDGTVYQRKSGIGTYNILLDGLSLAPGETQTATLNLTTLPLKYGHIQVGLYEVGESGDDSYGDILIKASEENCGAEADIYRSVAARAYKK